MGREYSEPGRGARVGAAPCAQIAIHREVTQIPAGDRAFSPAMADDRSVPSASDPTPRTATTDSAADAQTEAAESAASEAASESAAEAEAAADVGDLPAPAALVPPLRRAAGRGDGKARRAVRPSSIAVLVVGLGLAGVAAITAGSAYSGKGTGQADSVAGDGSAAVLTPFAMPTCSADSAASATPSGPATTAASGDPRARASAQKGLDYLTRATAQWQSSHNCYGCHVQAVTLEAVAVGIDNQYTVTEADRSEVLRGMLDLSGGARQPGGLGHSSDSIAKSAKIIGGAAFARYDQWGDDRLRDPMLAEARAVREMQMTEGHVPMPYTSIPVATGPIQGTAQAIVLWKQAYERTADDQWLTAISRAESYLHGVIGRWSASPTTSIVAAEQRRPPTLGPAQTHDLNYALMGLLAAG
ncbi:MAG: hypothetical protein AAGC55_20965, partial [Myxococcota bacterium]